MSNKKSDNECNARFWNSNISGYNHVLERLKYLEAEKEIIDCYDAYYEFLVIEKLINAEPNEDTRKSLWELVKGGK